MSKRLSKRSIPYVFAAFFFIPYLAFNLYPIIYSFWVSLHKWDGFSEMKFIGLQNYKALFTTDPYFLKSIGNTILLYLMSVPFALALALLLAVLLLSFNKSRTFFQTTNMLPYITTPVAIGLIFQMLFDWNSGVVNQILEALGVLEKGINWLGDGNNARIVVAILIVWKNLGYYLVIYLAGLISIPSDYYEAAKLDGASGVQSFFRITLPLLNNIVVFLVITSIISGLQLFDEPSLLLTTGSSGAQAAIGGQGRKCLTAIWYFYDVTFKTSSDFGKGAAIAYGLFMFIAMFSLVFAIVTRRRSSDEI